MGMGNGNQQQRITLRRITPVAILASALLLSTACQRQDPTPGASPQSETTQTTNPATRAARKSDDPNQRTANNKSTARATPAPNPALRRIRLTALTPDASPLSHAKATLWEEDKDPDSLFKWKRSQTLDLPADGKALLETTVTGNLALTIRADSFAITGQVIDRDALDRKRATAFSLRLTLNPAAPVSGTLWNADGTPAADAEILLVSGNNDGASLQEHRTTSTADGRFTLPMASAGTPVILARTGKLPFQPFSVTAPDSETSLTLAPLVSVKGQLIGKDISLGQTTAAINLRANSAGLKALRHVITDDRQQFDLGLLPAMAYSLSISATPQEVWLPVNADKRWSSGDFNLYLKDEKTTTVQVPVFHGISMSGLVLDETTSKALAGVRIYPSPEAMKEKRDSVVTTATGEFQLRHINSTEGIMPLADDYYFTGSNRDWRNKDELSSVILTMAPKIWLTGRVTDPMGNAISNVELTCHIFDKYGSDYSSEPVTINDQGEFRTAVFPDKTVEFVASAPSYALTQKIVEIKQQNQDNIEIRLTYGSTLRGRIVDFQDVPQPSVSVGILRLKENQVESREGNALLDKALEASVSDPDGRFEFQQVPEGEGIAVLAESNRFAYPVYHLITADSATSEIILRMPETKSVQGHVVDESGKGIPKADVTIYREYDHVNLRRFAKADNSGRFTFYQLPINTTTSLFAKAVDFKNYYIERLLKDEALSITLTRNPSRTLTIYCKDAKGKHPIAGAKVAFNNHTEMMKEREIRETNEPGKYIAEDLHFSSILSISAEATGYTRAFRFFTSEDDVTDSITLFMRKKSRFIGRAVTIEKHEPVAGVSVLRMESPNDLLTKSGVDGRFEIVNEGDYVLKSADALSATFSAAGNGQDIVDLGDIELSSKQELVVRVVDGESGEPVAGTKIQISSQENKLNSSGRTDSQGEFKVQALENADLKISLPEWNVTDERNPRNSRNYYRSLKDRWEIIIAVGSATIRGTVRKDDQPVWNSYVYIANNSAAKTLSTRSGSDGTFEFEKLVPGEWDLSAYDATYKNHAYAKVSIPDGKAEITKDLILGDRNGKTVIGTVYSSEGVAQANSNVIYKFETSSGNSGTDAKGSYSIGPIKPGPFIISATHPTEGHSVEISLDNTDEPGDTTRVDLILEKGTGTVECTAVSAVSGIILENYSLELKSEESVTISAYSSSQSGQSITVNNLKAGAYTAKVSCSGYAAATQSIHVQDGQTAQISVSLAPASYLTIRVKNSRGYSVPDASVTLTGGSTGSRTEKTDNQGIARFEGVEPGTYNASTAAPDGKTVSAPLTITRQPTAQYELLLP